jgi:hypothetical protein
MTCCQEGRSRRGRWTTDKLASHETESEASHEAEIVSGRQDLLREARDEVESLVGSDVVGEGPMAYLLALFFYGT